jgi:hypothetical protein
MEEHHSLEDRVSSGMRWLIVFALAMMALFQIAKVVVVELRSLLQTLTH